MFVEDIKNDFYNVLLGNRVLLLVHYDVDSICACKILQGLFKCDNISYTLVPVGGISELKTAYEENNEEIKYVVLINCGGTIDLVDILQPEEDVVFFVLDSHKPTDICNVYSDGQVRLVYKDEEENIPNFDDIFRDDDDEEGKEMDHLISLDDESKTKPGTLYHQAHDLLLSSLYSVKKKDEESESGREGLEAVVERRRVRKAWEERRHTLMFNYTQFSYYGKPSACVLVELCGKASRLCASALWAGAVASASHAALHSRPPARCLLDAEPLHRYAAAAQRHRDPRDERETQRDPAADRSACVVVEKDVWLPLYREWTLEAALSHSAVLAPKLKLHARSGSSRLRQLLADMGIPLQQARQAYRAMDVELRRSLLTALESAAPRHQLPVPTRASFTLRRPHSPPLAAMDAVYVLMALIEHETIPKAEGFQQALAALEVTGDNEAWRKGTAAAKRCLQAVASIVHTTLSSRRLLLAGPFSYFIVQEGSPEAALVRGPLWLGEAARWAGGGGARPLLASAPVSPPSPTGTCLLLGLPPRFDQEPRNLFGAAFEQAATKSGTSVSLDHVDTSVITLPTAQRAQFLDALTALLA